MREYGSEFEIGCFPDTYFRDLSRMLPFHAFTRSGREAIGLAIEGKKPGVVLLPAYSCWSMSLPFEVAGWFVEYYPLQRDLGVNVEYLKPIIRELKPKAILVMNFFGYSPTNEIIATIKEIDETVLVIEDFTQCLFGFPELFNPSVDRYVASIRKSLGVPDGGVVLSKEVIDIRRLSAEKTSFVEHHIEAGIGKKRYSYSEESSEKQLFRSLQAAAGGEIKADYHLYKISQEAMAILETTDTKTVAFARKKNYEHLYKLIKDNPYFSILFEPGNNPAPFMMIIKSSKRDALQGELAKNGVYCQVLWPLKERARSICPVSKEMEETMLAIPIDQRYGYSDIEEIGQRINALRI